MYGMCEVNAVLHSVDCGTDVSRWIDGQDCIAAGLQGQYKVTLSGDAGDYLAAVLDGPAVHVTGNAGRYAADTMRSGLLDIAGRAGTGAGFSLYGGTVVIRKGADGRVGQLMRAGTIVIDGDTGECTGLYGQGGAIIVTGSTGALTGDWLIGGTIYVGGDIESLGHNAATEPLGIDDTRVLTTLFDQHSITADPAGFTKIVPIRLRPFSPGE